MADKCRHLCGCELDDMCCATDYGYGVLPLMDECAPPSVDGHDECDGDPVTWLVRESEALGLYDDEGADHATTR